MSAHRAALAAAAVATLIAGVALLRLQTSPKRQLSHTVADGSASNSPSSPEPLSKDGTGDSRSAAEGTPDTANVVDDCRLRVMDEVGAPIGGVALWAQIGSDQVHLGTTDAEGELRTVLRPGVRSEVRGQGPSHVVLPEGVGPTIPEAIVLQAIKSPVLRGIVVGPNESPIGEGIKILVCEEGWPPDEALVRSDTSIAGRWIRAQTDTGGRFELHGLLPDRSYQLIAGGNGLTVTAPIEVESKLLELRVDVAPVYAAVLEIGIPEGGESGFDAFKLATDASLRFDDARVNLGAGIRAAAQLAGLDESLFEEAPGRAAFLFLGDDSRTAVGPLSYRIDVRGYEPLTIEFDAWRLDRGPAFHRGVLVPDVEDLARLDLVLRPPATVEGLEIGVLPLSHLFLHGEGEELSLRIDDPVGRNSFSGLPSGRFMVKVSLWSGLFEFPAAGEAFYVELVAGPNELVVDVPATGGVLVMPLQSTGVLHEGAANLMLAPIERVAIGSDGRLRIDGVIQQMFEQPPYRFRSLPAGRYALIPGMPFRPPKGGYVEVDVVPGEETLVELAP